MNSYNFNPAQKARITRIVQRHEADNFRETRNHAVEFRNKTTPESPDYFPTIKERIYKELRSRYPNASQDDLIKLLNKIVAKGFQSYKPHVSLMPPTLPKEPEHKSLRKLLKKRLKQRR